MHTKVMRMWASSCLILLVVLCFTLTKQINTTKRTAPSYNPLVKVYYEGMNFKKSICEKLGCNMHPRAAYKFSNITDTGVIPEGLFIYKNCSASKAFLLTKYSGVNTDIWSYCCSLGMVPGVITTKTEINCIYETYKAFTDSSFSKDHVYYVGFCDHTLKQDFASCPEKIRVPDEMWATNKPDNFNRQENGVSMTLQGQNLDLGFDDAYPFKKRQLFCHFDLNKTVATELLKEKERILIKHKPNNTTAAIQRDKEKYTTPMTETKSETVSTLKEKVVRSGIKDDAEVLSVKRKDYLQVLHKLNKIKNLVKNKKNCI